MGTDLHETSEELEALGSRRPTPAARATIRTALNSKWEGVQAVAASVLGKWGDRESIDDLKAWFEPLLEKKVGWSVRAAGIKALSECWQPKDADWILDMYFNSDDHLIRHELLRLIDALPPTLVWTRIDKEAARSIPGRQDAVAVMKRRLHANSGLLLSSKPARGE